MRMYTSYRGIRSTGGAAAPSGSRFRKCVLPGTPSLKTLIELPIGIVAAVRPPRPLLGEPDVEPRRDEPRSEEHTSELQSPCNLVCRLLLEKKKKNNVTRGYMQNASQ